MIPAAAATATVLAAAGVAAAALYGFAVEPYLLVRSDLDVPVADLPPELEGYTIAVLTDLHCGVASPPALAARAFEIAQRAEPDLVALLGDYSVSTRRTPRLNRRWYRRGMGELSPLIRALRAPDGVVGVLGNHDYYYDADDVRGWLDGLGVRTLVNESVAVRRGGATLVVGGVDDAREGRRGVDAAGGCAGQPADAPTVVLAHNPDAVLALDGRRRVDLVLAGHTHGGQVVLPLVGALATHARVCTRHAASGWVPNDHAPLYVSRGVGGQHPPRVNCRPEVVIVKLRAEGSAPNEPAGKLPVASRAVR